jgi:VIT1/CCC1 family predicted Fe2+/Mn2+ transporter
MSYGKRLDEAREGYEKKDVEASSQAHETAYISQSLHARQEEHGGGLSQFLGDFVYGGLDGIITTFAVVSGVEGASLGTNVILILGLANLFADGFSMATGAFLSQRSEQEFYRKEYEREMWEVEHLPEGEKEELKQIYLSQGYSEEESEKFVEIKTRENTRWVESMMVDELGMLKDERSPLMRALATFIAFVFAGSIPMLVFVLGLFVPIPDGAAFSVSVVLSGLALFGLGAAKVLVTHQNPWRAGLEMLLVGGLAASVAYFVGWLLRGIAS